MASDKGSKDFMKIIKIVLIAGIITCGVAQVLPWGEMSLKYAGFEMSLYFFHFGGQLYDTPFGTEFHLTPTNFSGTTGTPQIYGYAASTMLLFFIVPAGIFALGGGIFTYKKINRKRWKYALYSIISSLISIVLFIVFINVSFLSNINDLFNIEGISASYHWFWGFYLMIISTILYVCAFILIKKSQPSSKKETGKTKT